MVFSLEVRRARAGDCLMLHYGMKADPGLILIDGGPAQVYEQFLRPRLAELKATRAAATTTPLVLDGVMVSHIDDDHINGILALTKELGIAKDEKRLAKIRSIWHNTFDDIIGNTPKQLTAAVTAQFGAAALTGDCETDGLDPAAAMVLASVDQGIRLRDDIRKLGLQPNTLFGDRLVMATSRGGARTIGKGVSMTVAGPMKVELQALQKEHDTFLEAQKTRGPSSLAAFTDTSVPNLSSIVVLAEAGGKRILLTGDARGDKVLAGLELIGAMPAGGSIDVDVLKMPHHGSARNIAPAFFDRIRATHYVFSGNGQHGNPDRETLEMLARRPAAANYTIHLTYPIAEIDVERKADWNKERNTDLDRQKKNATAIVRPMWSPSAHSLASFFKNRPDMAKRVQVIDATKPHVIDLLEAI